MVSFLQNMGVVLIGIMDTRDRRMIFVSITAVTFVKRGGRSSIRMAVVRRIGT